MAKRKYISEFALNMHLTHVAVLQQDGLKNIGSKNYFTNDNKCHIYLICKRPRILLNTEKFSVNEDEITFGFKIQREEEFEELSLAFPNNYDTVDLKVESKYPYNHFKFYRGEELLLEGKSAILFQNLQDTHSDHLDLEILYVGQSYGVEGARVAPDRLVAHSTLQGIYAEAISNNPDSEIWLILTSFEDILITSIDGTLKFTDEDQKRDDAHRSDVFKKVFHEGLNEQQKINFTEAALIRYFRPPYNDIYKNNFPNPAHKTYRECYDLDIDSICIEVRTENISCRLYSEEVKPNWWHMHNFFLHSRDERLSMFDYDEFYNSKRYN